MTQEHTDTDGAQAMQAQEDAKNALDIVYGFVGKGREALDAIEAQIPTLKRALGLEEPPKE